MSRCNEVMRSERPTSRGQPLPRFDTAHVTFVKPSASGTSLITTESTVVFTTKQALKYAKIHTKWTRFSWATLCIATTLAPVEICAASVKAKFHYASWFEAGSKLVAEQRRTCL